MGAAATVADSPWLGAKARQPLGESALMTLSPFLRWDVQDCLLGLQAEAPMSHSPLPTIQPLWKLASSTWSPSLCQASTTHAMLGATSTFFAWAVFLLRTSSLTLPIFL